MNYTIDLNQVSLKDINSVGGKNSSLDDDSKHRINRNKFQTDSLLLLSISHLIKVGKKMGVKVGICGRIKKRDSDLSLFLF